MSPNVTTERPAPAEPRVAGRAPVQSPAEIAALKARALLDGITDLLVRYVRQGSR